MEEVHLVYRPRRLSLSVAVGLLIAGMAMPAQATAPPWEVVATGLDAPRGVEVAPNGAVYVAESGEGGSYCATVGEGDEALEVCYGNTGAVTRVWGGHQKRVLQRLPSLKIGEETVGPGDVSVRGNRNLFVSLGEPDDAAFILDKPYRARWLGWLIQSRRPGHWRPIANIGAFEANRNPDGGIIDSNPFGVAAAPPDGGIAVADSGGNYLALARPSGHVRLLAAFPPTMVTPPPFIPGLPDPFPQESVPTSVTVGPDGAFYVGFLTGFPFTPGTATVMRVVPGEDPTVYASGFTNVMDVDFGPDGTLYVLEMSHAGLLSGDLTGALWAVPPGGGAPSPVVVDNPAFFAPGGMDVAWDGSVYVSLCTVCVDGGELVHLVP
jgi:hypothetical protein